eukprot:scaffold4931_cov392-Prasinococcus_capsulatus_cf.AAC.3
MHLHSGRARLRRAKWVFMDVKPRAASRPGSPRPSYETSLCEQMSRVCGHEAVLTNASAKTGFCSLGRRLQKLNSRVNPGYTVAQKQYISSSMADYAYLVSKQGLRRRPLAQWPRVSCLPWARSGIRWTWWTRSTSGNATASRATWRPQPGTTCSCRGAPEATPTPSIRLPSQYHHHHHNGDAQ